MPCGIITPVAQLGKSWSNANRAPRVFALATACRASAAQASAPSCWARSRASPSAPPPIRTFSFPQRGLARTAAIVSARRATERPRQRKGPASLCAPCRTLPPGPRRERHAQVNGAPTIHLEKIGHGLRAQVVPIAGHRGSHDGLANGWTGACPRVGSSASRVAEERCSSAIEISLANQSRPISIWAGAST